MPIDQAKLEALRLIAKPSIAEVLKVEWDADHISYYAWSRYSDLPQYGDLPLRPVEARLKGEPFRSFQLNADLSTENISLNFDDTDGDIKAKFKLYGAVRAELFYYYAEVDLLISVFWGQLNKPEIIGVNNQQTTIAAGFRSGETQLPNRPLPNECTAMFGGKFTTLRDLETCGCDYNRHLGGSLGLLNPVTGLPFTSCPRRDKGDCTARWGHSLTFLGLEKNIGSIVSDNETGFLATTRNNNSIFKQPVNVVLGAKYLRNLPVLFWRAEAPDYLRAIYRVSEGSVDYISGINSSLSFNAQSQVQIRYGNIRQASTGYEYNTNSGLYVNFSLTSVVMINHGYPGAKFANNNGNDLQTHLACHGYNQIAVWSTPETYTRGFTRNRIWQLLECYTNKRWGLKYTSNRFDIESWIATAEWSQRSTTFTDADGKVFATRPGEAGRGTMGVNLIARSAREQITDICRSGRVSIPFQHDGKYHIAPIGEVSAEDLANARVFSDRGANKNIHCVDGIPSISFSQVSDAKLVNHVVLTFEDGDNADIERPIVVDDPDQKARAGQAMGENNFFDVSKRYVAFGVRFEEEVVKLANAFLKFGEFDSGGLENNLSGTFNTPFEQTLGLKKYEVIKLDTALLDNFESPQGNPFQFFRVMNMRKNGGLVEMKVQAYNEFAYADFEEDNGLVPETPPELVGTLPVGRLQFGDAPFFEEGNIVIPTIG